MENILTNQYCPENSVLLIGGAGFIGAHLTPILSKCNATVTVLGRNTTPSYDLPENVTYVSGDYGDQSLICSLLDNHQDVVHLAYATLPNTSLTSPVTDLLQNLMPSIQLFEEVAKRARKLIFVSSGGTVYGETPDIPVKEHYPTCPISPYGITKLTLESYARLYALVNNLKYICVRPSNAYGIGQRPFAGQGFISTAIASVMQGRPIRIFGEEGTVRDYLYVSDLAEGIVSALHSGRLSETYNLSSGVGFSNADVVRSMTPYLTEMGFQVNVENLPERNLDVKNNILSSEKLKDHTGWQAKISFNDGLDRTCRWMLQLLDKNKFVSPI